MGFVGAPHGAKAAMPERASGQCLVSHLCDGGSDVVMERFNPKPGHKALRHGRRSLAGQAYLVTFTTQQRSDVFVDPLAALDCCCELTNARHWHDAQLLAWVLMPDHWHGLMVLGEQGDLSCQVARIKACSARVLDPAIARPVWAKGFHDHAIRQQAGLLEAARYIVLNPVRAGLVTRCGLYPWWDAVWV